MKREEPTPSEPSELPGTHFIEWYGRQEDWLSVLLAPVVLPVLLFQYLAVLYLFFVYLPFQIVKGCFESRRYWQSLQKQGKVIEWPEAQQHVIDGTGTLIVETWPKGVSGAWLVEVPRDTLDPQHVAPTWSELEKLGQSLFTWKDCKREPLVQWSVKYLAPQLKSARKLDVSLGQVQKLNDRAKEQSVVPVSFLLEGLLNSP